MKFAKKALAVFMAALMLMSVFSISLVAYAQESDLSGLYRELAYSFFNFTTETSSGHFVVTKDDNGYPVRSIVGDPDQYEIESESDRYVYADEKDLPIRSVAYDHVVKAKDNMAGNIRSALNQYLKLADELLSKTYGTGYYTLPMMNDAIKDELEFLKDDEGNYLFLDGYTYLVSSLGNIVGRSKAPTYEVVNGKIKDLGVKVEDIEWNVTGTVGTRREIAEQIKRGSLSALDLFSYCNVSTILDYFGGNCTTLNSGNWFHKFIFKCDTDLETVLINDSLGSVPSNGLYERHVTVTWLFERDFDDSGTKAHYFNGGYTKEESSNTDTTPNKLKNVQNTMSELFETYYAEGGLENLAYTSLPGIYDRLASDLAAFNSISDEAKIASFGQAAYSFMNVVTQLRPLRNTSSYSAEDKYLPHHTYDKYNTTYQLTTDRVTSVVSNIDALMTDKKVGDIVKQFINFDDPKYSDRVFFGVKADTPKEIITQVVQNYLFNDDIINKIIGFLYPMVSKLLDENLTDSFITNALNGAGISGLEGLIKWVVEENNGWQAIFYQILLQGAYAGLTPAGFAWVMMKAGYDTKYPGVFNELKRARGGSLTCGSKDSNAVDFAKENKGPYYAIGKENDAYAKARWKDVDYTKLVWDINGSRDKFQQALDCVLLPLAQLLAVLLGNQSKDIFVGDAVLDLSLRLSNLDLYNDVLVPLLEALGVTNLCSSANFRSLAANVVNNFNVANIEAFLNGGILNPLLDWLLNVVLEDPISTIATLLPNVSLYLTSGALLGTISGIEIPLKLKISLGSWEWGAPTVYTLKVSELLGDKLAFLDSLQGVLNLIGLDINTGIPIVGYSDPSDSSGAVYRPDTPGYDENRMTESVTVAYKNSAGNMSRYQNSEYGTEVKGTNEDGSYIRENCIQDYACYYNVGTGVVVSTDASGGPSNAPTGTQAGWFYYEWEVTDESGNTTVVRNAQFDQSPNHDARIVYNYRMYHEPINLPEIMDYKLQSCGENKLVSSGREGALTVHAKNGTTETWQSGYRRVIEMKNARGQDTEGLVFIFLFRYLLSALRYRVYNSGSFTSDYTLLDAFGSGFSDTLNKEIMDGFRLVDIIDNVSLHPDETIAALFELLAPQENGSLFTLNDLGAVVTGQPYKYKLDYVNYYTDNIITEANNHNDFNYGTNTLYTKYWAKEDATYVVDNLDDIVENVLAMLKMDGMDSIGGLLEDLLVKNVFNNNMLSMLVGKLYGLLDNLKIGNLPDFKISEVLKAVLNVDYSKPTLKKALEYEFKDVEGYDTNLDSTRNDVWLKLKTDTEGTYSENYFYAPETVDPETGFVTPGEPLDWGFNNPAVTAKYSPAQIFLKAASAALSPFAVLIKFLFAGEDLNVLNLIHIPGYESFYYVWIPLMETFMANDGLESYKSYFTKLYAPRDGVSSDDLTIQQNCDAFYYLLLPLVNFVDDVLADPISVILNILPNVLFFLSIGGLSDVVNNLAHFAYVLLDMVSPIYNAYPLLNSLLSNLRINDEITLNLSLPLDVDVNQLVSSLIDGLLGDMLTFDIENKNIQLGERTVLKDVEKAVLTPDGQEQRDEEGNLITETVQEYVTEPVYAVGTLSIDLPYLDLAMLCAGTIQETDSVSGNRIIILNSSGGADLLTLILRLVTETLFFKNNAVNIADFLIGFCQLDDEDDNDDLLMEIFTYLNDRANEEEYPDKTLGLLFKVYKILVPIADNLGGRFKNVDFSITDMFGDMDNIQSYIDKLLDAGETKDPTLTAFQRFIKLLKQFFEKIKLFFSQLFSKKG